jgi:hypothetical protein
MAILRDRGAAKVVMEGLHYGTRRTLFATPVINHALPIGSKPSAGAIRVDFIWTVEPTLREHA